MRNEITAAVIFLVQLIEKNEKFSTDQLDCFRKRLIELLTERFKNHWFPDKPHKGQGYRCIRVNGHSRRDETLASAAIAAGVKYEDLSLPVELTLWVDPNEVCCRFGESKGSYCTLASFENQKLNKNYNNNINNKKNNDDQCEKENKIVEGTIKNQKDPSSNIMEQQSKPKPLTLSNQNHQQQSLSSSSSTATVTTASSSSSQQQQQQQQQQQNNNVAGRRRNLNSPRPHIARNRSWFNHSFNMGFGPHPMNQPWYNVMPPHFLGGPSPPPFIGHRGNKWVHPSSYQTGPTRFHHWSPKTTLKV